VRNLSLPLRATALGTAVFLCGCGGAPGPLEPKGPVALRIAELAWVLLALAGGIYVLVLVLLALGLIYGGLRRGPRPPRRETRFVLASGAVLPLLILIPLMVLASVTMAGSSAGPDPPALTIEVTGHQWWWEIRYPEHDVVTANEIHLPAGQPVQLVLTSTDVIHSFWVPELHGKMDLIPGRTNSLRVQADAPGVFRGRCAEFCGLQHARMGLLVIAEPADRMAQWMDEQRQPAAQPIEPLAGRGIVAFVQHGCLNCHPIRFGAEPIGARQAPDLTHVASRQTIAAATLPNSPAHLAAWLANPQASKPGNKMPDLGLDPDTVHALQAYLATLK
jgi:cytochrome c oxidase subunit 2